MNRYVRSVVAGLNRALELGHIGNPAAWRLKALSDGVEDEGETAVFLSVEQRKALMAAADLFMASFLCGLELTGARRKELANAVVEDFDGETIRLAHRKGRPPKLRVRRVVLSTEGINFFERVTRSKLPQGADMHGGRPAAVAAAYLGAAVQNGSRQGERGSAG